MVIDSQTVTIILPESHRLTGPCDEKPTCWHQKQAVEIYLLVFRLTKLTKYLLTFRLNKHTCASNKMACSYPIDKPVPFLIPRTHM